MSYYEYQDVYGDTHLVWFPIGEHPDEITLVNGPGRALLVDGRKPRDRFRGASRGWPIESFAMGVHPNDRFGAMKDAAARGVPTEFNENGNPIFRNPSHARRFRKAYGGHDRDGFLD